MASKGIFENSSLIAVIVGVLGLIAVGIDVIVGVQLLPVVALLLGAIALLLGLSRYMRHGDDVMALAAAVLGVVAIAASLWRLLN